MGALGCGHIDGQTRQGLHLGNEVVCGPHANRHGAGEGLLVLALQPLGGGVGDFGVKHHVEVGFAQAGDVGHAGVEGCDHMHLHAQAFNQAGDFDHIVAVAKAHGGGAQDVAACGPAAVQRCARGGGGGQAAGEVIKGFGRAKIFFALVGGQLQGHHRHRQVQRQGQATGVVLDQLGGARGPHQHGFGGKAFKRVTGSGFEQLGGVATQIARLEGGVGHRWAARQALDHGEQQIGIGVALGRVQHIVHIAHGGGDAHGPNVGRAFVCPEGELHGCVPQATSFKRRVSGRLNKPAKSPACS